MTVTTWGGRRGRGPTAAGASGSGSSCAIAPPARACATWRQRRRVYRRVTSRPRQSLALFTVDGSTMTGRVVDETGAMLDTFSIAK